MVLAEMEMEKATKNVLVAPVRARAKAVLVCVNGEIVGDCVVVVSEDDPNWWRSMSVREGGKITLRGGQRWR